MGKNRVFCIGTGAHNRPLRYTEKIPGHAHGEDIDQAVGDEHYMYMIVKHVYTMPNAKTDQAALMWSSCYGNTSEQPYQGTHIYTRIPLDLKLTNVCAV